VEVWQTGAGIYGASLWHHRLDCGHIESRKRRAPASAIGCVRCEAGEVLRAAAPLPEDVPLVDATATLDTEAAVLRAKVASALGVSIDSVTVRVSLNQVQGALVFLDPSQIRAVLATEIPR